MMTAPRQKDLKGSGKTNTWDLRLYVADQSPQSIRAFQNLKNVCEEHLSGRYHIKVIDVLEHPEAARANQIVALPTLIRQSPKPVRTGIGDLTNTPSLLDLLNRN
jgi:circadian clock protein KaiB